MEEGNMKDLPYPVDTPQQDMVNVLKEIPLHSNFVSCVLFSPSCSTHPLCGRNGSRLV